MFGAFELRKQRAPLRPGFFLVGYVRGHIAQHHIEAAAQRKNFRKGFAPFEGFFRLGRFAFVKGTTAQQRIAASQMFSESAGGGGFAHRQVERRVGAALFDGDEREPQALAREAYGGGIAVNGKQTFVDEFALEPKLIIVLLRDGAAIKLDIEFGEGFGNFFEHRGEQVAAARSRIAYAATQQGARHTLGFGA